MIIFFRTIIVLNMLSLEGNKFYFIIYIPEQILNSERRLISSINQKLLLFLYYRILHYQ
jgi:hypothetical protein